MLWVRHEPHYVALCVDDARDVVDRAVRVVRVVAEDDLPRLLELGQKLGIGEEAALPVLDRDRQSLPDLAMREERRVSALDAELDVAADEGERVVRAQGPGQETGFGEDLEAVADAEHEPAFAREVGDRL